MHQPPQYYSHISGVHDSSLRVYSYPNDAPVLTLNKKSDFVEVVTDTQKRFAVKRERHFLFPKYAMYANSEVVWRSSTKSLLQNRHEFQFAEGKNWSFRTPFFSVGIEGTADDGSHTLKGNVQRQNEWYFSIAPETPTHELLSAVAFLHWRCYFAS
jgi:hypothetical protein